MEQSALVRPSWAESMDALCVGNVDGALQHAHPAVNLDDVHFDLVVTRLPQSACVRCRASR
jgi:hypothetical protein